MCTRFTPFADLVRSRFIATPEQGLAVQLESADSLGGRHRTRLHFDAQIATLAESIGAHSRSGRFAASGLTHPSRNVPLPVQHTPDINMVVVFEVEDQMGKARQRPGPQARQVQLMGVSR